jgi:YHS domain-containing protein
VAILGRILRFVLWLLVATWLVRKIVGWLSRDAKRPAPTSVPPQTTRHLFRDPVCGTYVASEISRTYEHAGQVFHFCSAECRARFVDAQRPALSA